jgi:hypothetical protein
LKVPTLAQIAPLIRIFLPFIVDILTNYVGADTATKIGAVIASLLASSAWSLYRNTATGLTQTVAGIKDEAGHPAVKVLISSTAPQSLLNLASDVSVPEVVHAASVAPSAPPPKTTYQTKRRDDL